MSLYLVLYLTQVFRFIEEQYLTQIKFKIVEQNEWVDVILSQVSLEQGLANIGRRSGN